MDKMLGFPAAMQKVINGERVTKLEWASPNTFLELRDGFLMLHQPNKGFSRLTPSDGDMLGEDWVVVTVYSQIMQ